MCFWFCVSERAETVSWYRVINTVKMKKHPGLTGGCGSNVQSTEGNLQDNEAGSRQRVSSAPKAKEIVGVGGWAHKHRHLVLIGDLDLKGKEMYLKVCPGALGLRHYGSGVSCWGPENPEFGNNGAQGNLGRQEEAAVEWRHRLHGA